ncbi:MAG: phosphate signaling complex protein PhoU [Desulfomonile tiedjei]|uniref:Phosphate-specific transport system accessory protein PhoU n=1 Tax=Desulfomonile tiedjei TaxID=2358 RepID=A0A9D6V7E0_9BACT|nr:phosphate signaling complex protein PhoU [Desulfomonile tiedjei]
MSVRLQRDVEKLKKLVISLAALVEERFRTAIKSVECRDAQLARTVIDGDIDIDHREVDIEEECLKILALHQPVADHLRYIVAVLKLNNDLERIGDLAVNIAERAEFITKQNPMEIPFDYVTMSQRAGEMLQQSLDSLVHMDLDLAYQVCAEDDEVDTMKTNMQAQFAQEIRKEDKENVEALIHLFLISRHLERIADHATNIAEDVIYMITGAIHRHKGHQYK